MLKIVLWKANSKLNISVEIRLERINRCLTSRSFTNCNYFHLSISIFTSFSHPSYLTGKKANGSSIIIGMPDELMKIEE